MSTLIHQMELKKLGSQIQEQFNPTYQAFVTLQPDWLPFNLLGAGVANKRQYKTAQVPDLPHIIIFIHQASINRPTLLFYLISVLASKCNTSHSKSREFPN